MKELLEYIYHGKEERNLEYKQSMPWGKKKTKEKITKAVLAMSNLKEGGTIILGVKENSDGSFDAVGMETGDIKGYRQDLVASFVNKYADPFVEITVNKVPDEGKKFVVIQVSPFRELPVICKKGSDALKQGNIYIRNRRMNETAIVASQTEMREIIDLAVDINIKKFKQRFYSIFQSQMDGIDSDLSEKFKEELGEF